MRHAPHSVLRFGGHFHTPPLGTEPGMFCAVSCSLGPCVVSQSQFADAARDSAAAATKCFQLTAAFSSAKWPSTLLSGAQTPDALRGIKERKTDRLSSGRSGAPWCRFLGPLVHRSLSQWLSASLVNPGARASSRLPSLLSLSRGNLFSAKLALTSL